MYFVGLLQVWRQYLRYKECLADVALSRRTFLAHECSNLHTRASYHRGDPSSSLDTVPLSTAAYCNQ